MHRYISLNQHRPFQQYEQVILLVTMLGKVMVNVPLKEVNSCCEALLEHMRASESHICQEITDSCSLTPETREAILSAARKFVNAAYPDPKGNR